MGGQAVHENGIASGERHQFTIDLIELEDFAADFFFGFETHAGPGIGIDSLHVCDGFARVGEEFDFGFGFFGDAFGVGDDVGVRRVIFWSGDAEINAEARGQIGQRVADVVAVADVGELQAFERTEFFFESEEIGERLTGMEFVGERVDDGDFRGCGHFVEDALLVNARDDAMDPALEIAGDIGDGFAFTEAGLRVIEKNDVAAHALDADFEGDASAEGWFFEDEREEFSAQRVGVAGGIGLDVRRDREKFSRMRGTPFRSSEQIVRDQNRHCQSSCCHCFCYLAAV